MNFNGICPLISYDDGNSYVKQKCRTQTCAWWDDDKTGCCVIFSILKGIQAITRNEQCDLEDILNKIKD